MNMDDQIQKFWDVDHSLQILVQEDLRKLSSVDKSTSKSNALKRRNQKNLFDNEISHQADLMEKLKQKSPYLKRNFHQLQDQIEYEIA